MGSAGTTGGLSSSSQAPAVLLKQRISVLDGTVASMEGNAGGAADCLSGVLAALPGGLEGLVRQVKKAMAAGMSLEEALDQAVQGLIDKGFQLLARKEKAEAKANKEEMALLEKLWEVALRRIQTEINKADAKSLAKKVRMDQVTSRLEADVNLVASRPFVAYKPELELNLQLAKEQQAQA